MARLNRPDHPDFWVLSQVVIDNDSGQDNNTISVQDRIGQVIDPDVLTYFAQQRSMRAVGPYATKAEQTKYMTMWLDGFMAGAPFQAAKNRTPTNAPWTVGKQATVAEPVATVLAYFTTEHDAEQYLGSVVGQRDPEGLHDGAYFIDGPPED